MTCNENSTNMSPEKDKCVKEGYLWLPPQGVLSQLKKSWQRKYCKLYKASKYGIERLEVFDSEEDAMKTSLMPIITLENCIKITEDSQKHNQPHVFLVMTKTNIQHFAANSEDEMWQWVTTLQSVAFKDTVSRQTIEEDNDLYCSSEDAGVFSVRLISSDASERCGLVPGLPYTLVVTQAALQLRDEQKILFTWPYRFIRRYGYKHGKFTFEAGRKCESGEGTFHLEHSNQQEIFRCLSSKMKNMKKLLTGDSLSSPSILCGDNQFHAALNMMARSRSPLPPSPTGSTPLLDMDLGTMSSTKPLLPIPVEPLPRNFKPPPPLKPKPTKPPRKNLPTRIDDRDENASNDFPSSRISPGDTDYDDIEVRNDAWKTMGVGVMPHSERPFSILPQAPGECSIQNIVRQHPDEHHYDRLQHLGPTSKLHTKPGYRQITGLVPPPPPAAIPPLDVRAADDSHLGYGVIRKKSVPADVMVQGPPHQVYNDLEYAVVCKSNKAFVI